MKVKVKNCPNGAKFIYCGEEFTRIPSPSVCPVDHVTLQSSTGLVFVHRDTYVKLLTAENYE